MADEPKQIDHIECHFYGPRHFPVATGKIPDRLLFDFEKLLAECQKTYPQHTPETLMRHVFVLGLRAIRTALSSGVVPNPTTDPRPDRLNRDIKKLV